MRSEQERVARLWRPLGGSELYSERDKKQAEDFKSRTYIVVNRTGGQGQKLGDLRGGGRSTVV